ERPDEVRGVAQEPAALAQGLADEADVAEFEVAEPAVDELGGGAAGAGGEVALVDEADAEPAEGGVQRDAGAGDAAAEEEEVEGVAGGGAGARPHRVMAAGRGAGRRAVPGGPAACRRGGSLFP